MLALAVVAVAVVWHCRRPPTTLFLVRHADRAGRQDALSPAGAVRAAALAHALQLEKLAAIYHSDTRRTAETAAPLARLLGLTPIVRPAADVSALAREILADHRGERTLVVGHSNTIPQLIRAAGGPLLPDLAEDAFDRLFVLTARGCFVDEAELVQLRYGQTP